MNITNWLNENKESLTLFGTDNIEVVKVEAVRELFKDLQSELSNVITLDEEEVSVERKEESCERFKLEEGMFAYLPDKSLPPELLRALRGQGNYEVDGYLANQAEDFDYFTWQFISYCNGEIDVDDVTTTADRNLTKEIPYEQFLEALKG